MTTKPTEPDLIEEVEALLAKLKEWPGANSVNDIYRALFADAVERDRDSPFFGNSRIVAQLYAAAPDLLRRLVDEVKRLRGASTDTVIQKVALTQEAYPRERIDISIDPGGYCCVTRTDTDGTIHPIAEGATMGDVFED